ncbi:hypothetical protein OIV83_004835 [Microbotryomycetes sp. JL201]|nr:hypothetical protein OIV83_004835 [Microbotryomycetes sp. JL201]
MLPNLITVSDAYDSDDALEDAAGLSSSDSDFTYEDYDPETGRRKFNRVDESDDDSETSNGQIDFDRGNLQANKLDAEDLDACILDTVAHHAVDLESDEEWFATVVRRRNRAKSRAKALAARVTARPLSQSQSHSPKKPFQYSNTSDAERKRFGRSTEIAAQKRAEQLAVAKQRKRSSGRTEIAAQKRAEQRQAVIATHTATLKDLVQEWQAVMGRQTELASSEDREQLQIHHPLAAYLISHAQLLEALCQLTAKPLSADLTSLPGITKTEAPYSLSWDREIDRSGRIHVYLRVLKASVAQHLQWSRDYTDAYPAGFMREAPLLAATADLGPEEACQRVYAGLSSKKGGEGRASDDEGKSQAHLVNFVKLNSLTVASFESYELDLPGNEWTLANDTVYELRAHPMASSLEELVIAALGASRLNSHPGGLVSNYQPEQTLIDVLDAVNKALAAVVASPDEYAPSRTRPTRLSPTTTLDDVRTSELQRIEHHVDDCVRVWNSPTIKSGPSLSQTAIQDVKKGASGLEYSDDEYALSVRCLQDVTRAEFMVESTGSTFFGRLAGHGLRLFVDALKVVRRHNDAPAVPGNVESLGETFMNFWIILRHKKGDSSHHSPVEIHLLRRDRPRIDRHLCQICREVSESSAGVGGECPEGYLASAVHDLLQQHGDIVMQVPAAIRPTSVDQLELGQLYVGTDEADDSRWIKHQAFVRLVLILAARQRIKSPALPEDLHQPSLTNA